MTERIPNKYWISTESAKPQQRDADVYRCVLALHVYNGVMVTRTEMISEHPKMYPFWMPVPEEPAGMDEARKRALER